MPHAPKPFYRSARSAWYCQLGTKQIKLVAGPNDPSTAKLAWAAFHTLMAAAPVAPTASHVFTPTAGLTVGEVFEKFLGWCQTHRSPRTYEWSLNHIQAFCDHLKVARTLPATDLRPFHVVEWVDRKTTWGPNQKRGAIVAVTRPFNWAAKLGYLAANPVRGVEKPAAVKRTSRMTPEDFALLLSHVKDEPFRDLLTIAYEAGVRPQEARLVEARHLRPEHRRAEIPPEEAKGKKRWRVIYLSDTALAIATRLAALRPTGPLFLNVDGNPWQAQAIVNRFQRLLVKLSGAEETLPWLPRFNYRHYPTPEAARAAKARHQAEIVKRRKERARMSRKGKTRFAMYDIRHCFATRKLKEGHDPITVATLLGHKDTAMLARHYQELTNDSDHLAAAANGPR